MWIRKSDAEVAVEERRRSWREWRFNPARPACYALGVSAAVSLVLWKGHVNRGGWVSDPRPFSEVLQGFPLLALIIFAVCYIYRMGFGHPRPEMRGWPVVICNRCHERRSQDAGDACPCGGSFEPVEYWREETNDE